MNNWSTPGDQYSRYFDAQRRALEAFGITNPDSVFNAELKPEVSKLFAEMISLATMGAIGEGQLKRYDPVMGVSYHLLRPRHKATYEDMATWLQHHPQVQALPFSNPRWLHIFDTRHLLDRRSQPSGYLDLSEVVEVKKVRHYRIRYWNRDGLVPATNTFSHNEAIACMILPGDFNPRDLRHDPEEESELTRKLGLIPFKVEQWALPLEIRMSLLLKGYRLASQEDVGEATELFAIDNGTGGLVNRKTGWVAASDSCDTACIHVLGKPLGQLAMCPNCTTKGHDFNCELCHGQWWIVMHQDQLAV